jgi:hypothetical protein
VPLSSEHEASHYHISHYIFDLTFMDYCGINLLLGHQYGSHYLYLNLKSNVVNCSSVTCILGLPTSPFLSAVQTALLSMRQVLFKSINKEIQDLFHLTSGNYIHTDSLIVNCEGRLRKELSNQIENNVLEHITTLKEQGTIMQIMRRVSSKKIISLWNKITV